MDRTGTQLPRDSSAENSAETRRSYEDEELHRRCMEAVQRLARWLDEREAERAHHPDSPSHRSAQHDPFFWG